MDILLILLVVSLLAYIVLHYAGRGSATLNIMAELFFLLWMVIATLLLCDVHLEV